MDSTPSKKGPNASVRLTSIFAAAGFYFAGVITAAFISSMSAAKTSFSPLDLIGFTFSVALSGASIVLSLAAMSLGRASEDAMTRRSDESIRLQNEVFLKTTEALTRIESSTGVTEKRIEDIIAGRAGAIAETVVESAAGKLSGTNEVALQESIQKAIETTVARSPTSADRAEIEERMARKRREREEANKRYQAQHQEVITGVAALPALRAVKLGHGSVEASGDDRYDAQYVKPDGGKIYLSTFIGDSSSPYVSRFLSGALGEIADPAVKKLYVILFGDPEEMKKKIEGQRRFVDVLREDVGGKIVFVGENDPQKIVELIAGREADS